MGCVHSKLLKRHARVNGEWTSPPASKGFGNNSIGDCHGHSVDLLSTSYGLLKVPDEAKQTQQYRKGSRSHIDVYAKLQNLETKDAVLTSANAENLAERSTTRPRRKVHSMPELFETINVADMMRGLDEDHISSEAAESALIEPLLSVHTKPYASKQRKSLDKATSFHTSKELEMQLDKCEAHAVGIVLRDLSEVENQTHSRRYGITRPMNGCKREVILESDFEPSQSVLSCSNASYPQASAQLTMFREESVRNREILVRDKSLVEHASGIPPSEALASPFRRFSSLNGKVKITVNLEYENKVFTSSFSSREDAATPTRSLFMDHTDVLSDPGTPFFDPELLASYEKDLENLRKEEWNSLCSDDELLDSTAKGLLAPVMKEASIQGDERNQSGVFEGTHEAVENMTPQPYDPLAVFEKKCPPGGGNMVVLYTTTLRGIRKTYEDCNKMRTTLQSFDLSIDERDVSMHLDFRNELRGLIGATFPVPRLFIKGRYIGGADEVAKFNEEGKLCEIVEGLPKELHRRNCDGCGGVRFVPCLECSGSCKIVDESKKVLRCPDCNENGLIQCPICS